MRLSNPVESLDGVQKPEKYREHGTRIDKLIGDDAAQAIRKAVK